MLLQQNKCGWLLRLFPLLLAVFLTLPALGADRSEIDALRAQQSQLASQKSQLQDQLDSLSASEDQALSQKSLLEQQANVLAQEVQVSQTLLAQYDQALEEKEVELAQAQEAETAYEALFRQRVRAMEERGSQISVWMLLFQAESFADFLDRASAIVEIMDYDQEVIDELAAARQAVAEAKTAIEQDRAARQEVLAEQQAQQAELQQEQAQVQALISEIENQKDTYAGQITQLENSQDQVADEIAQAERTYASQLAAEKAAAQRAAQAAAAAQSQQSTSSNASASSSGGETTGTSGFLWPLSDYHRVTSAFGWRTHPISGQRSFHRGIDIAAPNGTAVMASKSGVVVISQYGNSYGNYVVLSHPDGTRTLYAHLSARNVSAGESVSQGQTIGLVGSTGSSTGNHLHFEIWTGSSSSSRVNPLQYF